MRSSSRRRRRASCAKCSRCSPRSEKRSTRKGARMTADTLDREDLASVLEMLTLLGRSVAYIRQFMIDRIDGTESAGGPVLRVVGGDDALADARQVDHDVIHFPVRPRAAVTTESVNDLVAALHSAEAALRA